jgi:hypothetical protein
LTSTSLSELKQMSEKEKKLNFLCCQSLKINFNNYSSVKDCSFLNFDF